MGQQNDSEERTAAGSEQCQRPDARSQRQTSSTSSHAPGRSQRIIEHSTRKRPDGFPWAATTATAAATAAAARGTAARYISARRSTVESWRTRRASPSRGHGHASQLLQSRSTSIADRAESSSTAAAAAATAAAAAAAASQFVQSEILSHWRFFFLNKTSSLDHKYVFFFLK